MKERKIIEAIRRAFPASGIGDDAAIVDIDGRRVCFSCDAAVEGVHFKREYSTLAQIVEKLISANVSDINAVGGAARGFLLTAGLPEGFGDDELEEILNGLKAASSFYSIELIGGDTVLSPRGYFFDIFIHGLVDEGINLGRSWAKAGDLVVLFGECGASAVGLKLLGRIFSHAGDGVDAGAGLGPRVNALLVEHGEEIVRRVRKIGMEDPGGGKPIESNGTVDMELVVSFVRRHLVPVAKPIPAGFLEEHAGGVHAAVDISDGLAIDLQRLARESRVGAKLRVEAIPIPEGMDLLLEGERENIMDVVLSSGEEYCIVAAVSPDASSYLPDSAHVIGEFTEEEALVIVDAAGVEKPLDTKGFEHTF